MTKTHRTSSAATRQGPPRRPIAQPAKFYSIVVHSSGASEIAMTGKRDTGRQDRELAEIFRTRDQPE